MFAFRRRLVVWILFSLLLGACSAAQPAASPDGKLAVIATTTLVGDVVRSVGGDRIDLTVLLPAGVDPHGYQPAPQDIAVVSRAQLVVANGAGLEEFLQPLLKNAGGDARIVYVSDGIELLSAEPGQSDNSADHAGEQNHTGSDPHVWFDPNLVQVWVDQIERALAAQDPDSAGAYRANADDYRRQLSELDVWVQQQVAQIPPENRKLVTDHREFGYFAARYGFELVGALIPSSSSLAAPSAQELAALEDAIHSTGVRAIFVGSTVSPDLAERVAADSGVRLVRVYTGSLTASDGPAPDYPAFIRYNVAVIVEALR